MTKILIDKETVERMVEVFGGQDWHDEIVSSEWADKANQSIATLRQALEQSTEQIQPSAYSNTHQQEPVMLERESVAVWLEKDCDEQYLADRIRAGDHAKEKATKGRESQCGSDSHLSPSLVGVGDIDSTTQKQEPVAFRTESRITKAVGYWTGRVPDYIDANSWEITPLYTQPQEATQRPQNCGTGYCSCIECVMKPTE